MRLKVNFMDSTGIKFSVKNLIKVGYFFEEIPLNLFTTEEFSKILEKEKINKLFKLSKQAEQKVTPCSRISVFKTNVERRLLNLMHIEKYFLLCKKIEELEMEIKNKINGSKFSQSKEIKPFNIANYIIDSGFLENKEERISYSIGNKYLLKLDLNKCYESIYTHAITWALYGKENAKRQIYLKDREKDLNYLKFNELDECVRNANNGETKGIPVGSITSRIISEIVLCDIDNILKEKYREALLCKRYVDDYKIYFHTKEEIEKFIGEFQHILHDYKFSINSKKTTIEEYPYEIDYDLKNEFSLCKTPKEIINKMLFLEKKDIKGALKYGLKMLEKFEKKLFNDKLIITHLLNILYAYPNLGNLIFELFEHLEERKRKKIREEKELLNKILKINLEKNYDVTIIWLLNLMIKFDVIIDKENMVEILEKIENFSTIMVLDYIFKKGLERDYANELSKLKEKLKVETIYGEKWLILYEANLNNWIIGIKPNLCKSKFLSLLYSEKISFYKSQIKN